MKSDFRVWFENGLVCYCSLGNGNFRGQYALLGIEEIIS